MMLAALSLASCSSDDEEGGQEYQPAHRSAIFNGVKLVLTDADGNDIGSQTEMFSSLKIYTQQLSADLTQTPLKFEESSAAIADWWNKSSERQD